MDLCKPLAQLYIPTRKTKLIVKATITVTTPPSVLILRAQVLFLSMLKTVYVYLHKILEFQGVLNATFFFGFIFEDEK